MGNKSGKDAKSKLTDDELDALIKRTSFTKKQIQRWYKSFVVRSAPHSDLIRSDLIRVRKKVCVCCVRISWGRSLVSILRCFSSILSNTTVLQTHTWSSHTAAVGSQPSTIIFYYICSYFKYQVSYVSKYSAQSSIQYKLLSQNLLGGDKHPIRECTIFKRVCQFCKYYLLVFCESDILLCAALSKILEALMQVQFVLN